MVAAAMMNRRAFLGRLVAGAAAVVAAPTVAKLAPLGPSVGRGGQTGATLETCGWTSDTVLRRGDVFTIDGRYALHPMTGRPLGTLQRFVVTADAQFDPSGVVTLPIAPAIVTSGPYRTASAAPRAGAAIRRVEHDLTFHRHAFAMVMGPLGLPLGCRVLE
jgi:hypothetical protein